MSSIWTEKEKALGQKIVEHSKKYTGNLIQRLSAAALACGQTCYASVPHGTKAFIESLNGKTESQKKAALTPNKKSQTPYKGIWQK